MQSLSILMPKIPTTGNGLPQMTVPRIEIDIRPKPAVDWYAAAECRLFVFVAWMALTNTKQQCFVDFFSSAVSPSPPLHMCKNLWDRIDIFSKLKIVCDMDTALNEQLWQLDRYSPGAWMKGGREETEGRRRKEWGGGEGEREEEKIERRIKEGRRKKSTRKSVIGF